MRGILAWVFGRRLANSDIISEVMIINALIAWLMLNKGMRILTLIPTFNKKKDEKEAAEDKEVI